MVALVWGTGSPEAPRAVGAILRWRRSHSCCSAPLLSSGVLQLVNASYGIKPLEASADYQHLVYPMVKENIATQLFLHNSSLVWTGKVLLKSENTTEVSTRPGRLVCGAMVATGMGDV